MQRCLVLATSALWNAWAHVWQGGSAAAAQWAAMALHAHSQMVMMHPTSWSFGCGAATCIARRHQCTGPPFHSCCQPLALHTAYMQELFLELDALGGRASSLARAAALNPRVLSASFLFWLQDLDRACAAGKPAPVWLSNHAPGSSGLGLCETASGPNLSTATPGFIIVSQTSQSAAHSSCDGSEREGEPGGSGVVPHAGEAVAGSNSSSTQPAQRIAALAAKLVELREAQGVAVAWHFVAYPQHQLMP
jgi:hypothetical protein